MSERFYRYRGFEISVLPLPLVEPAPSTMSGRPGRYRSVVRIYRSGSGRLLDELSVVSSGSASFETEEEAVLYGCFAGERWVNHHLDMGERKPHAVDLLC